MVRDLLKKKMDGTRPVHFPDGAAQRKLNSDISSKKHTGRETAM